ncbi:MAG: TraB/GumN family protein, partial [Ferruginibacter sp.]
MLIRRWTWWLFFGLFGMNLSLTAQKKNLAKYPSLLWEITGNGLKKPSYLFGTMHVSNKMAFHLSDSFYAALKSVDAVALELNPELWQRQMVQLELHKAQYAEYTAAFETEYFDENSFRIKKYDEVLKTALHTEPTAVNSLLYRSYKNSEDFEEDTFLDLYIFQTGRKLGKRASGVENYYETEQIILEAYAEMAKEKKLQADNETPDYPEDYEQKLQEAYRNGNLDVFDSLDIVTERSKAFREKFLYKRNEIQANSIDTIVQKSALFVGVGASHLPGERGVIELLRKKGYQLRPIKMANRDAVARENINRLKVPVTFTETKAADGFYSVAVPGKMYQLNEGQFPCDRWQYADMSNGAYYLVTRIKTHAAFIGETEKDVLKRVDSFLYENIPGKIISKKSIIKNGYNGVDISNRTRRGDVQRHQIFITPFEILIFKMNGSENYVVGSEAEQFFNSIQLKPISNKATNFSPGWGGFSINFPHAPSENLNKYCTDAIPRWEYEAIDKTSGDTYMLLKKSLYGLTYMEADSFELQLLEESFESPQFFDRQLKREWITEKNNTILEIVEKLKDSSIVKARLFNIGADYYLLAIKGKKEQPGWANFFNSFVPLDYTYPNKQTYIDTFFHFSVQSPVQPLIDPIYRAKIEKT